MCVPKIVSHGAVSLRRSLRFPDSAGNCQYGNCWLEGQDASFCMKRSRPGSKDAVMRSNPTPGLAHHQIAALA